MRATHIPAPSTFESHGAGSTPSSGHNHPHGSGPPHEDDFRVAYRRDLVLVRARDGSVLENFTPPDNAEALDARKLAEILWDDDRTSIDVGEIAEHLGRLLQDEAITVYGVTRNRDPLVLAEAINASDRSVHASVVLVTTITGHWTFAPGTDPHESVAAGVQPGGDVDREKFVAVIDTGYSASGLPDWLTERAEALGAIDAEPTGLPDHVRGHGAFVASLIAQEAPDTNIRVARVLNVNASMVFTGPPRNPEEKIRAGFASDELQLYVAVARLLSAPHEWKALNLSLGSYTAGDDSSAGIAIRAAMRRWNEETKREGSEHGAPVFAAAGNCEPGDSPTTEEFIPAAYGPSFNICAIGSSDDDDTKSNFSNDAPTLALGRGLVGVRDDGEWWDWGGSSFATALATARFLEGEKVAGATKALRPKRLKHRP